jgi:hypothetical protein
MVLKTIGWEVVDWIDLQTFDCIMLEMSSLADQLLA